MTRQSKTWRGCPAIIRTHRRRQRVAPTRRAAAFLTPPSPPALPALLETHALIALLSLPSSATPVRGEPSHAGAGRGDPQERSW